MTYKTEHMDLVENVMDEFQVWHLENYGDELELCDDFILYFYNKGLSLTECCSDCYSVFSLGDDCPSCEGERV